MHGQYTDITSRIADPIRWYDQHGCPRYDAFEPGLCPNIYSHQVTLLRIACQACAQEFLVEMHEGFFGEQHPQKLHYGDPPNHGCTGDSMNCEDLEVLESWSRPGLGPWVRHPAYEGLIDGGQT